MRTVARRWASAWLPVRVLVVIAACAVLLASPAVAPASVSAHSGHVFGPACGAATIDGVVKPGEWNGASRKTFAMVNPSGGNSFTATLYVMNGVGGLYLGITIDDDELSTVGEWLPQGDSFRIDFDNDHSGTLFALGDDVLSAAAGAPQFQDSYIVDPANQSARSDADAGGTENGLAAASRVGGLNHFEVRHPLCSGDSLDFCLSPGDTVGFRLEYLDAQADGAFGSSQCYPGSGSTAEADIIVAHCAPLDFRRYLPLVKRSST